MIKLHINEANTTNSSIMTVQDFMNKIEDTYHKYFPNSACFARFKLFMGHPYIAIHCFFAKDKSELSGGYWENDMINISFNINLPKDIESVEDTMPDSVVLETLNGTSFLTKPYKPEDKYCAYGTTKVPFRKTTGTPTKIITAFDKFSKKLYDAIVTEYNEEHLDDKHAELAKNKI